mgnify:CR=1 FL=1
MSKKVSILADELFPFYDWSDTQEKHLRLQGIYVTAEISDERYDRWTRVMKEFNDLQEEMAVIYENYQKEKEHGK